MSTLTHRYTGTLNVIECANCHMDFGVLPFFQRDRRDDHRSFYCPSGHLNFYPQKSDEEKLRIQLANERERREFEQEQKDKARRSLAAAKGQLTKVKKRIGKGVCPGCGRHFENVERHMASKHPELAE